MTSVRSSALSANSRPAPSGEVGEIFRVFLRLGLTSFGGPIAHLGYFRAEFVERRRWLSEQSFADLVALSQFLPGPASSQTGFGVGLLRGGLAGGLAAWVGFTLPSATLMVLFAYGAGSLAESALGAGLLHGLKLVAVAIVAQAVMGMARTLCPDRMRASIATLALVATLVAPWSIAQLVVIVAGGCAGLLICNASVEAEERSAHPRVAPGGSRLPCGLFCIAGCRLLADTARRSGAVRCFLPLRRARVRRRPCGAAVAAQRGRGSRLGSRRGFPCRIRRGASVAWAALHFRCFSRSGRKHPAARDRRRSPLPLSPSSFRACFALSGPLPFWERPLTPPILAARAAMLGTNAAVVGLLGAALYNPVWTSAVRGPIDFAIAAAGFVLLIVWRAPPLLVVTLARWWRWSPPGPEAEIETARAPHGTSGGLVCSPIVGERVGSPPTRSILPGRTP